MMTTMFWHRRAVITTKNNIGIRMNIWSQDQRQRTVQRANVQPCEVALLTLQKAENVMTITLVKRRSKITSKTTLNSRIGKFYEQEASFCCQAQ